jgi:hypothetical protein|tara:strand:+ start:825 stop:1136 length:312 start_codon:yes stop_codon:yes gene_type:complete
MDKIKGQLAGIAALIGVLVAIGGGFVKYGEIITKIDVLENASKTIDTSIVAVLEEKISQLESHKHEHDHEHGHTTIQINKKEIELLKVQLQELKISSSNPLSQ